MIPCLPQKQAKAWTPSRRPVWLTIYNLRNTGSFWKSQIVSARVRNLIYDIWSTSRTAGITIYSSGQALRPFGQAQGMLCVRFYLCPVWFRLRRVRTISFLNLLSNLKILRIQVQWIQDDNYGDSIYLCTDASKTNHVINMGGNVSKLRVIYVR